MLKWTRKYFVRCFQWEFHLWSKWIVILCVGVPTVYILKFFQTATGEFALFPGSEMLLDFRFVFFPLSGQSIFDWRFSKSFNYTFIILTEWTCISVRNKEVRWLTAFSFNFVVNFLDKFFIRLQEINQYIHLIWIWINWFTLNSCLYHSPWLLCQRIL